MRARPGLVRLAAGALVLGLGLLSLWQAGLIFRSDAAGRSSGGIELRRADASLPTPGAESLAVGLRPGQLAPEFEFSAYDGRRLRLSQFRGQPVFLNFWATWCGPCRRELPDMESVLQRYGDQGLVVIAVNNGEDFERGEKFIRELQVKLSAFAFDPAQDIVGRYAVRGMPTSYFIDGRGVVTRVHAGQLTRSVMESAVQEAIAGYGAASN